MLEFTVVLVVVVVAGAFVVRGLWQALAGTSGCEECRRCKPPAPGDGAQDARSRGRLYDVRVTTGRETSVDARRR